MAGHAKGLLQAQPHFKLDVAGAIAWTGSRGAISATGLGTRKAKDKSVWFATSEDGHSDTDWLSLN